MRKKNISDDIKKCIIDSYVEKNMTMTDISKIYNDISPRVVARVLRNNGIKIDSNRGNGNLWKLSNEDVSLLCNMYSTGLYSLRDLTKEFGICTHTIKKILISKNIDVDINRKRFHGVCEDNIVSDYISGMSMLSIAEKYNIADTTISRILESNEIEKNNIYLISSGEKELVKFIREIYDGEIILNTRDIISPLEIDIYIPEFKLAIEYNGDFFHSEKYKDIKYHKNKYECCLKKGIHLLQIFDSEWKNKRKIIQNIIKNKLFIRDFIFYARQCNVVVNYDKRKLKDFFDVNHIQGHSSHTYSISLENKGDIMASMLFTKRKCGYELVRYCTNGNIIGGFSKCLKNGIRIFDFDYIYSFADKRFVNENSNVYLINGFVKDKEIPEDYKYFYKGRLCHKFGFRHKYLDKKLLNYDSSLSEHYNCLNNNIFRVYDAGKIRYILDINKLKEK